MKHTIQTLKKNLTLAEVEAFEKELRKLITEAKRNEAAWWGAKKHRIDVDLANEWKQTVNDYKEILGK